MIAIPLDLENQITHLAEFEHTDPVSFLKGVIDDYTLKNNARAEETLFLKGVEPCLAEEWLDDEDEANYRDL